MRATGLVASSMGPVWGWRARVRRGPARLGSAVPPSATVVHWPGRRNRGGNHMRAAILEDGKVEIRDVPVPEPRADDALVRLTSVGVFFSDLHLVKGDWPGFVKPGRPSRLGHEGI